MNLKNSRLVSITTSLMLLSASFIGLGATAANASSAPVTVTFEANDTSGYNFVDYDGAATSTTSSAPAGAGFTSGVAMKQDNQGQLWSGTTFLTLDPGSSLLSDANKTATMSVYAPDAADRCVDLKLEGTAVAEQTVHVTKAGWQTLTFDYSGTFDAAQKYFKASVMPNIGGTGCSWAGGKDLTTWYFDNISFPGATKADVVIPRTTPLTLVNFESGDTSGYSAGGSADFGGTISSLDNAAPAGGSVGSTAALKLASAGACWSGSTFLIKGLKESLVSAGHTTVTANVYSPTAGKTIMLKLESSVTGGANVLSARTTVQGWQTISFDLSGFDPNVDFNKASIFPDFDSSAACPAKTASTWYIDDVAFNGATTVAVTGGSSNTGGPVAFNGNATVRLAGIDSTNSTESAANEKLWSVDNNWYRGGVRSLTKLVPVGSTQHLTFVVSDSSNGKALANTTVHFVMAKQYSGSKAKVNVGAVATTGEQAIVDGVTDSNGLVSFDLVNTDQNADGANNPGSNLAVAPSGNDLRSQITAWVTGQGADSIDVVDMVYYKAASIDPNAGITTTFENGDTSGAALGGSADFGGNGSSIVNSPVAGNTGMVGKIINGSIGWSGSTFLILPRGSQLISSSSKIVTADFYSTTPLDSVVLKLEGGTGEAASQVSASHGGTGWETLTFDFTGAFDPNGNYFKASIFADFNGANHAGGVYYFDNVHFVGGSKAAVVIPMTHTSTLVNFEAGDNSGYAIGATNDFGGTVSTLVTNAPMFGSTGSTKAAKIIPGNNCWAGTTLISMPWGQSGISADGKIATANVWAPAAGLSIKLKMEDSKDNNATIETDATTTKVGWQKLTWDFGTPSAGTAAFTSARVYNKVSVFPAYDCGASVAQIAADHNGAAWYLDDLAMNGATSAVIASMPAPVVSVLGATSVKSGAVVNLVGTGLYNLPGTSVALYTAATKTAAAITTPLTIVGGSADGTKLIVRGPAVTQKGIVKVTTNGGTVSSTATLSASSVATAKPALTMAANLVQAVGDVITLAGANIGSATAVTIGSTTAAFTVVDSNSITVTVPAGVVSGSAISVTNAGGTTTSTKFVYLAPTVASVTASAKVGDTITISGTNLAKLTSIVFGGNKAAKAVTNSATSVTVVVPTGALTGTIKLVNGGGTVNTSSFTVVPPAPTIKSFTPATGTKGTTVVSVSGTNLLNATVTLNGTAVTVNSGATATALKFTIPAGATSGKIVVTTAGGSATSSASLTVK